MMKKPIKINSDYFKRRSNGKVALTLSGKNARAGYLFILPFLIGFLAFMLIPVLESLRMVFSEVVIDTTNHGFKMNFIGFTNLYRVFVVDPEFNRMLTEEIAKMVLRVPAEIIFAIFIALLLNQDFKGRAFMRVVFFLPVILSSGVLIGLETNNTLLSGMAEIIRRGNAMKTSVTGVLENILVASEGTQRNFATTFMRYVFDIVNQVYDIAMASGIQIIIFLSALQTISPSMFEAAEMEGATKWECFWKITFPMISPLIMVCLVYSVVDYFLRTDNTVMAKIRVTLLQQMDYGYSTAMAWVYFVIVIVILGIAAAIVSKRVYYYE
ncbi:MAG: sugar ABC transporter permease [Spirochaetaceae bacterium]|jgi:ABC-type sugar transport system permease subunit|nr:sugar ABC transporter permease [Spirochaetaceae bacterium]